MPITSIVAAESSIVIAAPLFLLRWLVVVAAVTAWILLVPVVETARGLLSPLAAR